MRSNRIAALVVCGLVMFTMGCSEGPPTDESSATSAEMPTELRDANTSALKDQLIGTWELSAIERRDADGVLLPAPEPPAFGSPNPKGLLIYDADGHVALAIMQSGRAKGDQPTMEEAIADLDGYRAGFGTFSVNEAERYRDHTRAGCSRSTSDRHRPNEWGRAGRGSADAHTTGKRRRACRIPWSGSACQTWRHRRQPISGSAPSGDTSQTRVPRPTNHPSGPATSSTHPPDA